MTMQLLNVMAVRAICTVINAFVKVSRVYENPLSKHMRTYILTKEHSCLGHYGSSADYEMKQHKHEKYQRQQHTT